MKSIIVVLALLPLSVFAAELPTKAYSIQVKQAGVRDVAENLLSNSGLRYEIDQGVTNSKKVSMKAKQAKWSEIFENLMESGKLKYSFDEAGKLHVLNK